MNELERILALQANKRTESDLKYLNEHKKDLSEDQLNQLNKDARYESFTSDGIKLIKQGEDTLLFSRPLIIKDNSTQLSGTKYDIPSVDMSYFEKRKHISINHSDDVRHIVGNVLNLKKGNKKITIDGIKFALKQNPVLSKFIMDMMEGQFISDFSTETYGPWPNEEDDTFYNSRLMGLSIVHGGNNENATIMNHVAYNSLKEARQQGLDVSSIEAIFPELKKTIDKENHIPDNVISMFKTVKNLRGFQIEVAYKNAAGDEVKLNLAPNATVDVSEDQEEAVKKQLNDAKAPEEKVNLEEVINKAVSPLLTKISDLEKQVLNKSAKEPEFKKGINASKGLSAELEGMDYQERHGLQINYAWDFLKGKNQEAGNKLSDINKFHLEKLQEAKKVRNSMTIADFGNFVISTELLTDIEGFRSDFSGILGLVSFRETLSQQFAWLTRSGDIDMTEVEFCDDGADGNLKPVKEYTASQSTGTLKEAAAVTPVCTAATRFLAVDMLADIAEGYRTDYDRKRAQLLIAKLQGAVNTTGYKLPYSGTSDLTTLKSWAGLFSKISERVGSGGVAILNEKSRWELVTRALGAGISGPLAGLLMTGDLSPIFGKNYVVVPDELLPSLNSAETKTFTVDGVNVTIDQAVFFFQPATFTGRISGGLQYDLSTEASYEIAGTVYSAYQRNELVLRGSFFKGGAIRDPYKVSSMFAAGVS